MFSASPLGPGEGFSTLITTQALLFAFYFVALASEDICNRCRFAVRWMKDVEGLSISQCSMLERRHLVWSHLYLHRLLIIDTIAAGSLASIHEGLQRTKASGCLENRRR